MTSSVPVVITDSLRAKSLTNDTTKLSIQHITKNNHTYLGNTTKSSEN